MNENLNINEQSANGQDTFNGQQPPQPPTLDGMQPPQPPTFDGTQMPTFDGQQPPMMPPPPMFGGMQPPPMQGAPMWGNAGFAGEEMFNGNNLSSENFGAQNDLSGIVDMNGENISVNIGEQNNFAQGGMPPMFGGQDGQFNQPPQQAAQAQAE